MTGFNNTGGRAHGEEAVRATMDAIVQCCAACRHELNPLEAAAWLAAVESFGPERVQGFLINWISSSTSGRAPTVADLRTKVDPGFVNAANGLDRLLGLVKRYGPYDQPSMAETGALMARTIECMGGWAHVNGIMPDPSDRFAWAAFAERFTGAFTTASTNEFQESLLPPEQRAPLPAPRGLHAISRLAAGDADRRLLAHGVPVQGLIAASRPDDVEDDFEGARQEGRTYA